MKIIYFLLGILGTVFAVTTWTGYWPNSVLVQTLLWVTFAAKNFRQATE